MFASGKWSYNLLGHWLIFLPLPHSPSFSLFLKDLEVSLYISGLANVLQGSLDYIIFG